MKSGYVVDQDFIPRINTSASVVFEGVCNGESPLHTVMWTIIGYPACGTAIPLLAAKTDHIPYFMKSVEQNGHCYMDDISTYLKDNFVFTENISNGNRYFNIKNIIRGNGETPSLLKCCIKSDKMIEKEFSELFNGWKEGKMNDIDFYSAYDDVSNIFMNIYETCFSSFLQY